MRAVLRKHQLAALLLCAVVAGLVTPGVANAAGVVKADAGEWYSLAVLSDGSLWGWGYNSHGQLGDGTLEKHLSPSRVDTGTAWADVSAGYRHTLAIKSDGSLWSWGYNKDGQLGIGHAENTYVPDHWHNRPTRVGTASSWAQISAGYDHSVALDLSGGIWAWGGNDFGQLGTGSTEPTATPVLVSATPGLGLSWKRVWADDGLSLALASDGTLWQWGQGTSVPEEVASSESFVSNRPTTHMDWLTVSPTPGHIAVVMADSGLWGWEPVFPAFDFFGYEYLDVAQTTDLNQTPPAAHALMLGLDHSLWIATNDVGTPAPLRDDVGVLASKKFIIGNALNWTKLSAGRNHFLIAKSDGSLWGWGKNTFGQLGDGSETDRVVKTQIPVRTILPTPIPNITGMTHSDAVDRIEEMGFKVGTVTQVATDTVEITRIISQTPACDTLVMPGGLVHIVVSAGPPIPVPNVVGMQEADARFAIGNVGLGVSTVSQDYSSIVPSGAVISQLPAAATPVIIASKVSLVVSKGPQPKTVPYTTGRTETQARSTLTASGFVPGGVTSEYSTVQVAGRVTRTNPAAGAQAFVGDTVHIYVSLGKPRPSISNPSAPSTMYLSRAATVSGTLRPRHTAGTLPVRIYRWRSVNGVWRAYGYVRAKAANYSTYSRYSVSMKLSTKGKWRLRAYHPEDAAHAARWSSGYDYVTVK